MSLHFIRSRDGTVNTWLRDRTVTATPGNVYRVYDVTVDPEAYAGLAEL